MNSKPQRPAQVQAPEASNHGAPSTSKRVVTTKADQMSPELVDFIKAIDDYKRIHGRPFPSWGEVLNILTDLGYAKGSPTDEIR